MKMHIPGMIRDTGLFSGGAVHGKGGGGQPTTSTVNQSNLPEYARPYFGRLMARTEAASNTPYQAYVDSEGKPINRIAGASEDMLASYRGARNMGDSYLPSFNQASQAYTNALDQAGRTVSGYDPTTEMWTNANRDQYMNPYTQDVIRNAQAAAQNNFAESQGARNAAAARAGAFNSSRSAVADALARREYDTQFQTLTSDLLNKGYNNAQAQFIADRTARINNNQYAADLGMKGAAFGLEAGSKMQGLGNDAFARASQQANMLNTYGQQQQNLQQKGLDQAYENFANQRDAPRQNLSFLSGILHGVPVTPQSNSITYQPGSNNMASVLGTGIAAYGALNGKS